MAHHLPWDDHENSLRKQKKAQGEFSVDNTRTTNQIS